MTAESRQLSAERIAGHPPLARLPLVTLYVTDRCNSRCVTCDYWRHGRDDMDLAASEGVAPTRLRGVGVYTDLEVTLKGALRAEASAHSAALFSDQVKHNPALVPAPAPVTDDAGDEVLVIAPVTPERISA